MAQAETLHEVECREITEGFIQYWTDAARTGAQSHSSTPLLDNYVGSLLQTNHAEGRRVLLLMVNGEAVTMRIVYVRKSRGKKYIDSAVMVTPKPMRRKGFALRLLQLMVHDFRTSDVGKCEIRVKTASSATVPMLKKIVREAAGVLELALGDGDDVAVLSWKSGSRGSRGSSVVTRSRPSSSSSSSGSSGSSDTGKRSRSSGSSSSSGSSGTNRSSSTNPNGNKRPRV
jgi:hypothetical protein